MQLLAFSGVGYGGAGANRMTEIAGVSVGLLCRFPNEAQVALSKPWRRCHNRPSCLVLASDAAQEGESV